MRVSRSSRPERRFAGAALLVLTLLTPGSVPAHEVDTVGPTDGQALDPAVFRAYVYRSNHDNLWAGARARKAALEKARREQRERARALQGKRPAGNAARPEPAPPPTPDVPVAPRDARRQSALAPTLLPANVMANDGAADNAGQSEVSVGSIGDDVLVSWNDGQGFNTNGDIQGYALSGNGGAAFTDHGDLPTNSSYATFRWRGDPVVACDEKSLRYYVAGLGELDANGSAVADSSALFIAMRYNFIGWHWTSARVIRALPSADYFLDKEWVAADSSTGNVYVVYTLFVAGSESNYIQLQRSTDGGYTWSTPKTLSSAGDAGDVQGARVACGPSGEVHVVWYHNDPATGLYDLRYRRSVDGGVSFGAEQTPHSYVPLGGTGAPGFNRARGIDMPSLAVDRTNGDYRGRSYIAFAECFDYLDDAWPAQPAASTVRFESESNNTSSTADAFSAGNTLRGDFADGSTDWWRVSLTAGQHLEVWCDSLSTGTFSLYLSSYPSDVGTRLTYSGVSMSPEGQSGGHFIVYAASSGSYYLQAVANTAYGKSYRIRTRIGNTAGGFGRDRRDPLVTWAQTSGSWSTPDRVTSGAVGSDDFLPEVAVGQDGYPYVIWLDQRDDTWQRANATAYVAHSADGGGTWSQDARLGTVTGDFFNCSSNLAPNMGDYLGLAPGNLRMHAAWGDARGANVDVWTSSFSINSGFQACTGARTVPVHGHVTLESLFQNSHDYATNYYRWQVTDQRGWLVPELRFPFQLQSEETMTLPATVQVPGDAPQGQTNDVCVTVTNWTGSIVRTCCTRLTVDGTLLAVEGGAAVFALHPALPNPARGRSTLRFSLPVAGPVTLALYDVAGARVRTLIAGSQAPGEHAVAWDGRDDAGARLPAGYYFARLEHAGRTATRRLVLLQ